MSSPYALFYGGANWKNGMGHKAFKFLMPGWCSNLKEFAIDKLPKSFADDGVLGMGLRVLISILVILVFLFVFYSVLGVLSRFPAWNDAVLRTKNAVGLVSGFEGIGAVTTRDITLSHLGSLNGLPSIQAAQAADRFNNGEPPVFFDAPSYVLRKDEMINNALGEYSREKAAGTTTLSWNDWLALNSGRFGTFGEASASLSSLGRTTAQQQLASENFGGDRSVIPTQSMMGLY